MPTIAEIEANLLLASSTGNKPLFNSTLSGILPEQFPLINVYTDVLNNLTELTNPDTAKSMTRSLMSAAAGPFVEVDAIGTAMQAFSADGNYAALDALTDYLTPTQTSNFGSTAYVGQTLLNISLADAELPDDDATIKAAVRNLMGKLGEQSDSESIGAAMSYLASQSNFGALDAVTDYLTLDQKIELGLMQSVSDTLQYILNYDINTYGSEPMTSAVRNLMGKLGTYLDSSSLDAAISISSNDPAYYGALDALTDYLTPEQITDLASFGTLGQALTSVVSSDSFENPDAEAVASMVRNLMNKFGTEIDTFSLGVGIIISSFNANFSALDAITDFLTDEQKVELAADFNNPLEQALDTISNYALGGEAQVDIAAAAVRNFMSKVGTLVDGEQIGISLFNFSFSRSYESIDAITDYLTAEQKAAIGATGYAGPTLQNIIGLDEYFSTEDDQATADAVLNFMNKLGDLVDAETLGSLLQIIPEGHFEPFPANFAAMNAIIDNLTPEQITALGTTGYPSQTLYNLVSTDFGPDNDDAPLAETIGKLIKTLGDQIDIFAIGDAMLFFSPSYIQNWQGLKAIVDNLSDAKITELNSVFPIQDDVLYNIISSDNGLDASDDIQISNVIHNFMSTLGEGSQGYSISEAITQFSILGNFHALDAATDYLTAQQLENIAPFGGLGFGIAVQNITYLISQEGIDPFLASNAVRDLMSKIGTALGNDEFYEDQVIQSVGEFATWTGDAAAFGIDAILGELPTELLTTRIITEIQSEDLFQDYLQQAGVSLGTVGNDAFTGSDLINDKFIALAGNDTLNGLGGNDELYGDKGKDTIYGGLDNDILYGGSEKDTLYGDEGDDDIFGGTQADTLYGGSGADTFWFDANDKGTGVDVIKDFSLLDGDKINISDVLEQYDPNTDELSGFVRLSVSGADTLLQVDMTGPGVAGGFASITKIEGVTGLDLDTLVGNGTIIVV